MSLARKVPTGGSKRPLRKRSIGKSLKSVPATSLLARKATMAAARLAETGRLTGEASKKLSVRVDPGLLSLAAERVGADNPTDIINTALILLASPDPFTQWFLTTEDTLPEDFESAL